MNTNKQMGELLYGLLPDLYKKEDAGRTHLKRFLQVNGVGLEYLRGKTEGHANMFDLDKTPPELLPHIARMMGFDFPYDMTVKEQRSMLKILPTLYRMKGTQSVFDSLARQLFGLDAKAFSEWKSRAGDNGENQIQINVEANGETANLQTRIDRYYKYSEQFRPINNKLFWRIVLHYVDDYPRQEKMQIDYLVDKLFIDDDFDPNETFLLNSLILTNSNYKTPRLQGDWYDKYNKLGEIYTFDKMFLKDEDIFSRNKEDDSFALDVIRVASEDSYDKAVKEAYGIERIYINDDFPTNASLLSKDFTLNDGKIPALQGEVYNSSKISEQQGKEVLWDMHTDIYNKEDVADEVLMSRMKIEDADSYMKTIEDSVINKAVSLVNSLNVAKLNSTMLLSKKPEITYF